MGQHNSFKKDIDMLSEAYHQMYGKGEVVEEGKGGAALGAAGGSLAGGLLGAASPVPFITAPIGAALGAGLGGAALSDEEDKTGGKSDYEILKRATTEDGNLKPEARDALAKLYGSEDAESATAKYPTFHKSEKKKSDGYNPWDDIELDDEEEEDTDEADADPEAEQEELDDLSDTPV